MMVLGVDPGTYTVGWGLLEFLPAVATTHLVRCGTLEMKGRDADLRLNDFGHRIGPFVESLGAELVIFEKQFSNRNQADQYLHVVAHYIRLACKSRELLFHEVYASTARKRILGKGNANKEDVTKAMTERFGFAEPLQPDVADALLVALAGYQDVEGAA